MKHTRIFAVLAVVVGLAATAFHPAATAQVKGYHFVYKVSDRLVQGAPTQVFHDGKRTYFQFARGIQTPTIFVSTPGGEQLTNHVMEEPYVVVQGVHDRFALVSERGVRIDVQSLRPVTGEQGIAAFPSREAPTMNGGRAAPLEVGGRASEPVVAVYQNRSADQMPQMIPTSAPPLAKVVQPAANQPMVHPAYIAPSAPPAIAAQTEPVLTATPAPLRESAKHAPPVSEERRAIAQEIRVPLASARSSLVRSPLVRAGDIETIGVMPKQPGIRARGKGSLRDAVERIVPSHFKGFEVGGVDVEQQVTWSGNGRTWTNVLRDVLAQGNVRAVVNFDTHEVTLHQVSPRSNQLAHLRNATASVPAVTPPVATAPAPVLEWTLIPASDKTLSRALERWVERAGWQLAWDAQIDYPLELRASFGGSFEEAINKVAISLATAERPLHFHFHDGNKVLRVSGTTPATPYAAK